MRARDQAPPLGAVILFLMVATRAVRMKVLSVGLIVASGISGLLSVTAKMPEADLYHGWFLVLLGTGLLLLPGGRRKILPRAARTGSKVAGALALFAGLIFLGGRYMPGPMLRSVLDLFDLSIYVQAAILGLCGYEISLYVSHSTASILTRDWLLLLSTTAFGAGLIAWTVYRREGAAGGAQAEEED